MRWMQIACCSVLFLASPAQAAWLEASSDHFVIYSDQNEKTLRGFAERLELFHSAMVTVLRKPPGTTSPSNRVTIFVVTSRDQVRELGGGFDPFVAGFYRARAGSSVAVVPRLKSATSQFALSPETVLLHEYAHHFMAGITTRAYPRWFSEGFAEFFSSARFQAEHVALGAPATHRAGEIAFAKRVPIRSMLDYGGGVRDPKGGYDAFYGQSWSLFHYLAMAPERAGQLSQYQRLLGSGRGALAAAETAFGDLDQLEADMRTYQQRRRLEAMLVKRESLPVGVVTIRPVSRGMAEMMPVAIRSRCGVTREQALDLLPEARRIAARHPDDAAALVALAEAESDAGNDDEAIAAADQALALDPRRVEAYIHKGTALWDKIDADKLPQETWKQVRQLFLRANAIENDHPVPLMRYYLSFRASGERPTPNAIDGLAWAMQLAPFDPSLRWLVVQQLISDDRLEEAVRTLEPLAYSAHRGEFTDRALELLKELEARVSTPRVTGID